MMAYLQGKPRALADIIIEQRMLIFMGKEKRNIYIYI